MILCGLPVAVDSAFAQTWTQTIATSQAWFAVASSADGSKLVTAATGNYMGPGQIYTSTNSGSTWTLTIAPSNSWVSVASSADGNKLVAAATGNGTRFSQGAIYTSTNSGGDWNSNNVTPNNWGPVASSADGTKLVAVVNNGGIFTSTNSGGHGGPIMFRTMYGPRLLPRRTEANWWLHSFRVMVEFILQQIQALIG